MLAPNLFHAYCCPAAAAGGVEEVPTGRPAGPALPPLGRTARLRVSDEAARTLLGSYSQGCSGKKEVAE